MVGKRLLYVMEVLLLITLFAFFSSFVVTTNQNDTIVDATEEFAEVIRYKGAITKDMYDEFLNEIPTPVKVGFVIDKGTLLHIKDPSINENFSQDVLEALDSDGIYKMRVGDEVKVIVRKMSPTAFDKITELFARKTTGDPQPIIAVKGGLVLNEKWH